MFLKYPIPLPLRSTGNGLRLRSLYRRDDGGDEFGGGPIIVVAVLAVVFVLIVSICVFLRVRKHKSRGGSSNRGGYQQTGDVEDLNSASRGRRPPPNFDAAVAQFRSNGNTAPIDRNTSVRSIMTLPAYRKTANESEQTLGREGDRDGVDVVVELQTAENEEDLREEEMEAMYRIRLARRAELAERSERRRQRTEARARGDMVALGEIAARTRAASSSSVVSDLQAEHQRIKDQRQRAVSSVSYGDLGVARHDGSRIRASSQESERVGLLSDAASITLSTHSPLSLDFAHRRERSASSVLSFDSQDFPSPGPPRSGATTPRRLSAQNSGGAGSSPEIIGEADLGDADMPPHSPPGYDDISLDDGVSGGGRSGVTTPFPEPPPDYPGPNPTEERDRTLNRQVADMVETVGDDGDLRGSGDEDRGRRSSQRSSRSGIPHLPSLRIRELPQIVVEPSSAYPNRERR